MAAVAVSLTHSVVNVEAAKKPKMSFGGSFLYTQPTSLSLSLKMLTEQRKKNVYLSKHGGMTAK